MQKDTRRLEDLISVGPAMLRDFQILRVRSVAQLARQDPERLYEKLCRVAPQHQDICCLDVFHAAVAQARDPRLPVEQSQWWYWSRKRKEAHRQELRVDKGKRK
jgi:Pathogenicity locus